MRNPKKFLSGSGCCYDGFHLHGRRRTTTQVGQNSKEIKQPVEPASKISGIHSGLRLDHPGYQGQLLPRAGRLNAFSHIFTFCVERDIVRDNHK